MAVGDVVSDLQSLAAGANLDFQPASGVEVMITEIGSSEFAGTLPERVPNVTVRLNDGTLTSDVRIIGSARLWSKPLKLFINNSIRLQINNVSASTRNISYCGIQTK